jgi:hypothetical protein
MIKMVRVNIYGGLGNQMFQYAFGKSLAISKKADLSIDSSIFDNYELRNFQLDKFNVDYKRLPVNKMSVYNISNKYKLHTLKILDKYLRVIPKMFFEKKLWVFDDSVFNSESFLFVGYWQSFKYFENIRDVLLKEFTLRYSLETTNLDVLYRIQSSNSVSLHIRRGDYVVKKSKQQSDVCPIGYYEEAIKIINNKIINPCFFIFSDDIEWVKLNLNVEFLNCEFVYDNGNNPECDLELMKNCQNNIIANSTFSWWGAWLNNNIDKTVIVPKIWMYGLPVSKDLVPTDWIII